MINVGIAGIGFMGVTHFDAWERVRGAGVSAVCTRSEKKLAGDWSSVQGNFGGSGGVRDVSHLARYSDLGDLIHDDRVDLIDLCLPTPMHPDTAVSALEAGKHVLVEKPIALNLEDADRMIDAARASGHLLMVSHILRFFPEFNYLKHVHEDGRFGKLLVLNLRRLITKPKWSTEVADFSANGGPLIDLHIHDVDFLLYLLGKPARLHTIGREQRDTVLYVSTNYEYPGGPQVSCQSGAVAASGRPFMHEYEACFEMATIRYAFATEPAGNDPATHQSASQSLTVYQEDGSVSFPELAETDAFFSELQHVADCVNAGTRSAIIGAESARDALAAVYLEGEALRSGKVLEVPA